jgi:phosphate transport system substrate-binding protein
MRKYLILPLLAITAMLAACSRQSVEITVEGSTTVLPFAQKAAEVYMDAKPDISISVRGGGSGVGITSLTAGAADMALSSRGIKNDETAKARANNINPHENIIAMDAIALIVNPANKTDGLTKEQVKNIFTGKISRWKELGGDDRQIVVVSRDSASGTFESFNELALDKEKVSKDALMQASNQGVANIISNTPGAIGYVGFGYITGKTKAVSINGVKPSVETVLAGKYSYYRPLIIYTNGAPEGEIKNFLDFIIGKDGQRIAKDLGFIPLK